MGHDEMKKEEKPTDNKKRSTGRLDEMMRQRYKNSQMKKVLWTGSLVCWS
jgi:hypothetical protein